MTNPLRARTSGNPVPDLWGVDSEHGVLRDVLIGPVDNYRWSDTTAAGQRTRRLGYEFDLEVAKRQWREVIDAFEGAGVRCHVLEPDPHLPFQVFARDSSVMTPWGAIISQMYSAQRRGESTVCARFYLDMGIPVWDVVTAGSFEGGDFMVLEPGLVLCGNGNRTSPEGQAQVAGWFEEKGWEVHRYSFDPFFLHMDTQFAVVAEKLAVACLDALEDEFVSWIRGRGYELIPVPFKDSLELGTNVVALGNDRVVVPRSSRALIERCRAAGLHVLDPDVSMISGGGGAIHCMTQALRRDPIGLSPANGSK